MPDGWSFDCAILRPPRGLVFATFFLHKPLRASEAFAHALESDTEVDRMVKLAAWTVLHLSDSTIDYKIYYPCEEAERLFTMSVSCVNFLQTLTGSQPHQAI